MLSNVIAHAYLTPSRSVQLPTTPGRKVKFAGGQAKLTDERDVVILLRHPDVNLEFSAEWAERLPGWIEKAGEGQVKAKITLPQENYGVPHQTVLAVEPKRGRPRKTDAQSGGFHNELIAGETWADAVHQDQPD